MADSRVTLAGTVGRDPEQRTTANGSEVVKFSLAVTERRREGTDDWKDGPTSWYQVDAWGTLGKNVAASVQKGQRVLVHGSLTVQEFQARDGGRGKVVTVRATSVGHDLTFGTARFDRTVKAQAAAVQAAAPIAVQAAAQVDHSDEWAAPGTTMVLEAPDDFDDPPF
jgi:single-strand DNA-binding protein